MAELAHFQNFAKLKDTKVEFNDITVLAGKPSTGKSYIMKYFYAINEMFYKKIKDYLVYDEQLLASLFFEIDYLYARYLKIMLLI